MKILVTGAKGFVGKNLVLALKNKGYNEIFEYDIDTPKEKLSEYTKECDFVYHLAGVNRPKEAKEFMEGNFGFTSELLESLKLNNNKAPIVITSSIQAILDNDYGKSKKAGEDLLFNYSKENEVNVFVYRLPNLFGKWCRPNYNSVIATFCNNIANDLPIQINDENVELTLAYIDDVVEEFISCIEGKANKKDNFCYIKTTHKEKLGYIAEVIKSFKESRNTLLLPNVKEGSFEKKLYSTYLSYLNKNDFSYPLKMNVDNRGSFTELFKTSNNGQISVNISKPGITKGNHWHDTKNEKFVVVKGKGIIRFKKVEENEIIEYNVSGDKLEVIDIPVGYTHNIENIGDEDMVTIMWANEIFNPDKPDTYFLEV